MTSQNGYNPKELKEVLRKNKQLLKVSLFIEQNSKNIKILHAIMHLKHLSQFRLKCLRTITSMSYHN